MTGPAPLPTWAWVAAAAGILGLATTLWLWRRPSATQRMADDAALPYRRWVQNVFLLVTTDCDYAHISGAEARRILAHWWEVFGPMQHRHTLAQLANERLDHAWNLIRFIVVSRLGVAAHYYDDELSWAEILPVARRLQATYPDWRAMGQAYVLARRHREGLPLDGSADTAGMRQVLDNLARLDDTRWAQLDFKRPLHDEPED